MTILDWNGSDIPNELERLPPGRYVITPVNDSLSEDEEAGIEAALAALREGRGVDHKEIKQRISAKHPA